MAASNDDNSKSFLGKQDSFYESSNKRDSLSVEKKNTIIEKVETVYQNLRLINGRFPTISSHFFANIFHKTEVQTVILRCWTPERV